MTQFAHKTLGGSYRGRRTQYYRPRRPRVYHATILGRPNDNPRLRTLNAVEDRMRNHLASVTMCAGLVVAGLVGGLELRTQGRAAQAAPAAQAPVAPPDAAALRAQYERWRTEFKTWA